MAIMFQVSRILLIFATHLWISHLCESFPLDKKVMDLTFNLTNDMPMWPGYIDFDMTVRQETGYGDFLFRYEEISTNSHLGTHVDAPRLFHHEGWSIDEIPEEALYGPGVVIDASEKIQDNVNYSISVEDIVEFEEKHGRIPDGALVFFRTGWDRFWHDPAMYVGSDDKDVNKISHPGLSEEAAIWLTSERNIVGVGIDTLSVDMGADLDFKAYRALNVHNKWGISAVANLDKVPPTGLQVHVLPLKLAGASGSVCRILAFY